MSSDDQADRDEPAYAVGYGKPPAHSRFKPGHSGNPKGKQKGAKSPKAIVRAILNEKVPVRTARGTKKMTRLEALVHTMTINALKGDAKATDQVMKLTRDLGLTEEVAEVMQATTMRELAEEDRAILERFVSRTPDLEAGDDE